MATKHQGTPQEVRALNLHIALMRCARSVKEGLDRHLAKAGFTENQFGVLEILEHLGPQKPAVIGEKLFTSRPNVTQLLDSLEKRKLIERRRCSDNRREIDVYITDDGRAVICPLFRAHLAVIVEAMSTLSAEEQEGLARMLVRLGLQNAPPRDT